MIQHDDENYNADECLELFAKGGSTVYAYEMPDGTLALIEDTTEETVFQVFGRDFDESDSPLAERFLTETFWANFGRDSYGDDEVMRNEDFNNWTDSLCKNGDICDDSYNELCFDESA